MYDLKIIFGRWPLYFGTYSNVFNIGFNLLKFGQLLFVWVPFGTVEILQLSSTASFLVEKLF